MTQRCFQITPVANQVTIWAATSTGLEKKNGGSRILPNTGYVVSGVPKRERDHGDQHLQHEKR